METAQSWRPQGAKHLFFVAFLLVTVNAPSWAFNCSPALSPWIYINESYFQNGNPVFYDGEPLRDIAYIRPYWNVTSLFLRAWFLYLDRDSGEVIIGNAYDIDGIIPEYVQLEGITSNYLLQCNGSNAGRTSSITVVLVDENDEPPTFTYEAPTDIHLSEDTCTGQEIYNFAYKVRDWDFADKPNESKLQLVILYSEPQSDTFTVNGRLGLQLEKALNKNLSPYVLTLVLKDQALRFGPSHNFTVFVTQGWTRDSNDYNFPKNCKTWKEQPSESNLTTAFTIFNCSDEGTESASAPEELNVEKNDVIPPESSSDRFYFEKNCTTLNETHSDYYSGRFNCTSGNRISMSVLESQLSKGLEITYRGYPIHNISSIARFECWDLANSSFDFLNVTDNGTLVVRADVNFDDVIKRGSDAIRCVYELRCPESLFGTWLYLYILEENDEEPTFTKDTPEILDVSQKRELVYNFSPHAHDKDFEDMPNDAKLELLIAKPLMDSCGNFVSGVIAVTERLKLRIQPPQEVAGCSYQFSLALKDHASRIGPHHNMTLYISADLTTIDSRPFNCCFPNRSSTDQDAEIYCETQTVNVSETRAVTLPRTLVHSVFELPCLLTGKAQLVAICEQLSHGSPIAKYNVTVSKLSCSDNMSLPQLVDLYLVPITESNIVNVTLEIDKLTDSSYELQPADISYISRILNNLARFYESCTNATELISKVSPYVAGIVNNLMEANANVLEEARSKDSELTTRIVGSFDRMLLKLTESIAGEINRNDTAEDPPAVLRKNVAYQVSTRTDISGLGTCSFANGTTKTVVVSYDSSTSSDCILIGGLPHAELKLSTAVRGTPRVFVLYTRAVLFGSGAAPDSSVLSAQLAKTPGHGGSSGEELAVFLRQRIDKASVEKNSTLACGYWNFYTNRWDTGGCSSKPAEDGQGMFVCTCDHLTNFAVLVVPFMGDCGRTVHDDVLGYLSLILLTVSCIALLLVLITFFAYRKQQKSDAGKLTACLSASLLCMNLLFIFGINAVNDDSSVCSALAAVLHYFVLASFLFMTAEVILAYIRLVKILDVHVSYFIWKVLAVCLGVPAGVIIGVWFGNPSLYVRSDQYCWVQPILQIYGVMLPIGLAIAFNLVMFVLIARAFKSRPHFRASVNERKQAILQAKALAAVFVVLGITWAFGLLAAIEVSSVVFQYLFVISNALQGLFVFIFHAVKAPFITRCLKNKTITKAVGFTPKQRKQSDSAGGDMSLSTTRTTNEQASGRRKSSSTISELSQCTSATNNDISRVRFQ